MFNFTNNNKGSICTWQWMNLLHTPKRAPDYVSISGAKIRVYEIPSDYEILEKDGDNVIKFAVGGSTFELKGYSVDYDGDTYAIYEDITYQSISKYWYGKAGVYRLSDHWFDVGKSQWDITNYDDNELQLGYSNYNNFIPK